MEISQLDWYLKLTWVPTINKKQKFVVEQVFYGRDTLEELMTFFKAKDKYNLKRVLAPLLGSGILVEEEGKFFVSEEAIEVQFAVSGGDTMLREYFERIGVERAEFDKKGMKANDERSNRKIKAALEGNLDPDELTSYEQELVEKYRVLIDQVEMLRIKEGYEAAATFAKEQGYYHPELNPGVLPFREAV